MRAGLSPLSPSVIALGLFLGKVKAKKEGCEEPRITPNNLSAPRFNSLLLVTNLHQPPIYFAVPLAILFIYYFLFKVLPPPFNYFTADWNSFISTK